MVNNSKTISIFIKNQEKILNFFLIHPIQIFSVSNIQKNVGMSPITIKKYLVRFIEEGFIKEILAILRLHLFYYNLNEQIKSKKEVLA